jgi:hypothetical protein
MRGLLCVALLAIFALPARAQVQDPGTVLVEPYLRCEGCQALDRQQMQHELQQLQRARPSRFGPIAVIIAGAAVTMLGFSATSDENGFAPAIAGAAAGSALLTAGILWHRQRARERRPLEQRIARLRFALRGSLPVAGYPAPANPYTPEIDNLYATRPSLVPPILLTVAGISAVLIGSLVTLGMSIGHTGARPYDRRTIPGETALFAAGCAALIGGATWWHRRHQVRRSYNLRIRSLQRLDYSAAPLLVRW